jgi:hypothetical protein
MGYFKDNGEFADADEAHFGDGVLLANRDSDAIETDRGTVRLALAVTAVSGTDPTLDVTIQTSEDKVTWRNLAAFTQATGVTRERKCFSGCDRFVRAHEVLGGSATPTVTRSITGEFV